MTPRLRMLTLVSCGGDETMFVAVVEALAARAKGASVRGVAIRRGIKPRTLQWNVRKVLALRERLE